jgi:hypothetical protein
MGMVIAAGLFAPLSRASAGSIEPLTIELVVINRAQVPERIVSRATTEAVRIYRSLGINLGSSTTGEFPVAPQLIVTIVSRPGDVPLLPDELATKSVHERVLGVAPGHQNRRDLAVWAFWARIENTGTMRGIDPGVLLGHVIAHEIGHLLLPYDAHSESGIMRAAWDKAQATHAAMGTLTFDRGQAALIRRSVAKLAAK